jgi:tetratricopeptide (TPR) repeat protein
MTLALELTAAELELIENKRKQDSLAKEAELLKKEAKLQKDIIAMETAIRKEQNNCNDQVIATKAYLKELQKLNPNYKLVEQDKELSRHIWGEYLPDNKNYEREILKEFKYNLKDFRGAILDFDKAVELKPTYFANGGDRKDYNTPEGDVCKELGITLLWGIGGDKIQSSSWLLEKNKD